MAAIGAQGTGSTGSPWNREPMEPGAHGSRSSGHGEQWALGLVGTGSMDTGSPGYWDRDLQEVLGTLSCGTRRGGHWDPQEQGSKHRAPGAQGEADARTGMLGVQGTLSREHRECQTGPVNAWSPGQQRCWAPTRQTPAAPGAGTPGALGTRITRHTEPIRRGARNHWAVKGPVGRSTGQWEYRAGTGSWSAAVPDTGHLELSHSWILGTAGLWDNWNPEDKLEKSLSFLQQQMEEVFRSQNEEEANMLKLKKMADSLGQNIAAEFTTLHQFLNQEEQQMKGKLKDDVERLSRQLRENLQRITEKRASIECTILEIQERLNVQETAFLADVKSLIERSYVKFKKPAEVPLNLLLGEFGGPLQLIVWKRMLNIISPVPAALTLEPSTAHPELLISEDLQCVRLSDTWQELPDNPERFDDCVSVLSAQGFDSGRHYWQVEVGNKTMWDVGLAKESVSRKGSIILSPEDGFWTIWLRNGNEYEALSTPSSFLSLRAKPKTIGVFLDYEKGQVSFYNADDMSVIYTFTDHFSERLFPYFSPGESDGGKNAEPLKLCGLRL